VGGEEIEERGEETKGGLRERGGGEG